MTKNGVVMNRHFSMEKVFKKINNNHILMFKWKSHHFYNMPFIILSLRNNSNNPKAEETESPTTLNFHLDFIPSVEHQNCILILGDIDTNGEKDSYISETKFHQFSFFMTTNEFKEKKKEKGKNE